MTDDSVSRRRLLATLGTTTMAGLAGCGGSALDEAAGDGSCPPYDPVEPSRSDWRGKLGPPTNTATVAPEAVPEGELTLAWEAAVETHVGHHVPVVADGTVYAHDLDDGLSAFDTKTGDTQWTTTITDPVTAPAVSGATLVVTTRDAVRAFDSATGDARWTRDGIGGSLFDASPIIADDTVYLQRGTATHALALADGTTRWRVATGLPSRAMPAVTASTVYVGGDDTYVRALSTTDGRQQWRVKTAARIRCNLTAVGDTLLAGTDAGTILALDATTGTERWRTQLAPRTGDERERPARPHMLATDGSRVYVATDTRLIALALADGTRCWRVRSYEGTYASGIAVGAGSVYLPTADTDAHVTVVDAASGDSIQQLTDERLTYFNIGPSLAEGGLYVAGGNAVARLD